MDLYFQLALMPIIGGLIGWSTNLFAIKLIFRPLRPVKIPLLGLEIQGLIPKRRLDISRNIGEALEHEIISPEDIIENMISEKTKSEVIAYIKDIIVARVGEKLPGLIPSSFRESIAGYIGNIINRNGEEIFDELKVTLIEKTKEQLQLKELVEEKSTLLTLKSWKNLIIRLSKQELKQIEVLGGIIGFL